MYGIKTFIALIILVVSTTCISAYLHPGEYVMAIIYSIVLYAILLIINVPLTLVEFMILSSWCKIPSNQAYKFTFKTNIISTFSMFLLIFIAAFINKYLIIICSLVIFSLVSQQFNVAKQSFNITDDKLLRRFLFALNIVIYVFLAVVFVISKK